MSTAPPRPLVVRFGALGDMVLLTPLLALLRQRYGVAPDVLSAGAWTPPLYADHPDVHQMLLLGSRKRPYWSDPRQWRAVAQLRATGPRPVYVCDELATAPLARLLARAGFAADEVLVGGRPPRVRAPALGRSLAGLRRAGCAALARRCPGRGGRRAAVARQRGRGGRLRGVVDGAR
ncbi:glycosyl transferase family protein, partial [mine drainage metagenome]